MSTRSLSPHKLSNMSTRGCPESHTQAAKAVFLIDITLSAPPGICFFADFWLLPSGNPLSIIGYCNLMMERNLGYAASITNTESAKTFIPGHTATAAPVGSATATATAGLEDETEATSSARERGSGRDRLGMEHIGSGKGAERATVDPQKPAPCATVFR